jgi:TPR repeat protein
MTSLISILSQFETRCKMVLIFTFGLTLLLFASAGKLHANDHSKAQMQYMTGLKLLKDQSQNGIAAHGEHKGVLFHLGVSYEKGQGVEKDLRLAAHFYRLATTRHHVATQYNLAVMMASGKGVKRDLEKVLTLILIAKQHTGLKPNARLWLNQFQTAIKES